MVFMRIRANFSKFSLQSLFGFPNNIIIFALSIHNDTKKDEKNELNQKSDNRLAEGRADYLPGCPRRDFAEHLLDHRQPLRQDLLG